MSHKTKVAILGGGPSALTAAYYLTSDPRLCQQYDITLYTMGWRLGGKGASGRRAPDQRIEEHGLHILFGSYHSFFRTMRDCYEELDRPADHPMSSWEDAFKPHSFGVLEEKFRNKWYRTGMYFPPNSAIPGDRGIAISGGDYLSMALQALVETIFGWRVLYEGEHAFPFLDPKGRPGVGPGPLVKIVVALLNELLKIGHEISNQLDKRNSLLIRIIEDFRKRSWQVMRKLASVNYHAHRFWLGVDFTITMLTGLITDGVLEQDGFAKIDDLDFRAWLERHGAHEQTMNSTYVRAIYDAAFAYENGNPDDQEIAAGVAVNLLLGFAMYRGSMYYKMQAGMGDTVFAPMYQVLKRRGVKFRFFHKVDSLHLTDKGHSIKSVRLTRQAKVDQKGESYQPLVMVKGLECWPSEPDYDQLYQGDELKGVNLESYYEKSPHAKEKVLKAGEDFDKLIFGIPIGVVPWTCDELLVHSERWRNMVAHVTSVQTVALQLWLKPDLADTGFDMPSPLLSLYVEPLNTWSDMSQVLPAEEWPAGQEPGGVHYFTGAQPGPSVAPMPDENPDFEREMTEAARHLGKSFLFQGLTGLMPALATGSHEQGFDWSALVDPRNGKGEERFEAQYWRSNCGPSERCTLAAPGSIRYRMQAGDTGYDNLVVTGDWIDNGLYAACMEGAFNAGILAARAVCGWHFEIDGLRYNITRGPLHPDRQQDRPRRLNASPGR